MLRIYDEFLEDENVTSLSDRAYRLHVSALLYSSRNLTDGEISAKALKVIQAILGFAAKRYAAELAAAGLWISEGDAHRIRNYLEFNPDSETVKQEKAKARERMRTLRKKRVGSPERSPEHSPERDGERSLPERSLPPHTLPSHAFSSSVVELHALPTSDNEGGHEEKLWRRLCAAAGANTPDRIGKLERTVRANRSTEREIVCAAEAATGPGVRDPLAVALSELKKLADARAVA